MKNTYWENLQSVHAVSRPEASRAAEFARSQLDFCMATCGLHGQKGLVQWRLRSRTLGFNAGARQFSYQRSHGFSCIHMFKRTMLLPSRKILLLCACLQETTDPRARTCHSASVDGDSCAGNTCSDLHQLLSPGATRSPHSRTWNHNGHR